MEGTALAKMYRSKDFTPISQSEYASLAAEVISRMHPDTVLHRITGDCPEELLVAPEWNRQKHETIAMINRLLESDGISQGCKFKH
jgi:radical SAM superfamily enzyme